jgi:hypothetical protein
MLRPTCGGEGEKYYQLITSCYLFFIFLENVGSANIRRFCLSSCEAWRFLGVYFAPRAREARGAPSRTYGATVRLARGIEADVPKPTKWAKALERIARREECEARRSGSPKNQPKTNPKTTIISTKNKPYHLTVIGLAFVYKKPFVCAFKER